MFVTKFNYKDSKNRFKTMKRILFLMLLILPMQKELLAQVNSFGMNFDSPSPFTTQWVFKDAMKQSAEWTVREFEEEELLGDIWVSQDSIAIPSLGTGYPQKVPFEVNGRQYGVSTIMLSANPSPWYFPDGNYTLIFEGTGLIRLHGNLESMEFSRSGTHTVPITNPGETGVILEILSSDITDPIRNIQFFMPGFGHNDDSPFHPDWMSFLSNFDVIRPMKALNVEYSNIQNWQDRTMMDYYTQYDERGTGMALEYVIDLHNELGRDLYLNINYLANDAMVDSVATLVLNRLNPNLDIYLEYSNETWNSIYPVFEYVMERGSELGLTDDEFMAGQYFTVMRSVQVFEIFERVFDSEANRLIKVIPCWVEFPNIADSMLTSLSNPIINPNNVTVDKLAIGLYFGGEVGNNLVEAGRTAIATTDEVLDSLRADLDYAVSLTRAHKEVVDRFNIDLITYEAGQHLITNFFDPDPVIGQTMNDANRDEEMYHIYRDFLREWTEISGDLNVLFSSVKSFTEFGSFGIKEHLDQPDQESPKMRAYLDHIDSLNTVTSNESFETLPSTIELSQNYPNPFNPSTTIQFTLPSSEQVRLEVFNTLGQKVAILVNNQIRSSGRHQVQFDASQLASGVYIYRLQAGNYTQTKRMLLLK